MHALLLKADGFSSTGVPASDLKDVAPFVEHGEVPVPVPGPGQVLIRVRASMVNPSDLSFIQGNYGQPRVKGAPAGFEGVGEVVDGKGFMAARLKGKRVSFVAGPTGSGAWAEYAVADAATVIKLRADIRDEDGAAMIVNPLTAAAMVGMVPPNGAFVASAAASQLGKLMAPLARDTNRRMIALVRRDAPVAALKELGAAHVLNETAPDFDQALAKVLAAEKPKLFLDAVSGAVSARVFNAMGMDARWVVYGKLTPEPPEILEPGKLIFMRKRIEGFWLVTWMRRTGIFGKLSAIRDVQSRFADGRWKTDISARVPLRKAVADLPKALRQTDGKIMIEIGQA
ncbi:MAG: zinc-binding dehydrogenase [Rhodobacteraceae bacterium]|nr:zinc-binding dehydrogenase [Paracoccaceae bacterium]